MFDVVDAFDREEAALEREEAAQIVREIRDGVRREVRSRRRCDQGDVCQRSRRVAYVCIDGALDSQCAPRDANVAHLNENGFRVWSLEFEFVDRAKNVKHSNSCVVSWALDSAADVIEAHSDKTGIVYKRCVEIGGEAPDDPLP